MVIAASLDLVAVRDQGFEMGSERPIETEQKDSITVGCELPSTLDGQNGLASSCATVNPHTFQRAGHLKHAPLLLREGDQLLVHFVGQVGKRSTNGDGRCEAAGGLFELDGREMLQAWLMHSDDAVDRRDWVGQVLLVDGQAGGVQSDRPTGPGCGWERNRVHDPGVEPEALPQLNEKSVLDSRDLLERILDRELAVPVAGRPHAFMGPYVAALHLDHEDALVWVHQDEIGLAIFQRV